MAVTSAFIVVSKIIPHGCRGRRRREDHSVGWRRRDIIASGRKRGRGRKGGGGEKTMHGKREGERNACQKKLRARCS